MQVELVVEDRRKRLAHPHDDRDVAAFAEAVAVDLAARLHYVVARIRLPVYVAAAERAERALGVEIAEARQIEQNIGILAATAEGADPIRQRGVDLFERRKRILQGRTDRIPSEQPIEQFPHQLTSRRLRLTRNDERRKSGFPERIGSGRLP